MWTVYLSATSGDQWLWQKTFYVNLSSPISTHTNTCARAHTQLVLTAVGARACVCVCVQLCRVLVHVYVCPQLMTRHVLSAVKQLCNNGGIVYVQYELHPQAYAFISQKYLIFIQCKHVVSPDMSMSLPSVDWYWQWISDVITGINTTPGDAIVNVTDMIITSQTIILTWS